MSKIRMLWLSDIHLKSDYKLKLDKQVKSHCKCFIEYIKANFSSNPFDYLVIGGDLAFSGSKKEYENLSNLLINPLKEINEGIKLICVPGNHDISWKYSNKFGELLKTDQSVYERRTKAFKEDKAMLLKNFADYSQFVKKIGFNDTTKLRGEVKDGLYGYLIDDSKKVIFILLNSAWFSIGTKHNDLLVKSIREKRSHKHYKYSSKELNDVLRIKDDIVEYGNQMIGDKLLEEVNFPTVLSEHPDYTVFTLMHHPLNWLNWNELYKTDKKEKQSHFHYILKKTNFLLTGHEHVPSQKEAEIIKGNTFHLKAGCFIDDIKDGELCNHENNRFSVIEIFNNKRKKLKESRYLFEYSTNNDVELIPHIKQPVGEKKDSKKDRYETTFENYLQPTIRELENFALNNSICEKLIRKFSSKNFVKSKEENGIIKFVSLEDDCCHLSIFFSRKIIFDGNCFNDIFHQLLHQEITNSTSSDSSKILISIFVVDLFFRPLMYGNINFDVDTQHEIREERQKREDAFHKEKIKINKAFDKFRFEFFENENHIEKVGLILHFLPYWSL